MLKSENDIINFGKHKGKSVRDVMLEEPSYLVWLMTDTDRTSFDLHLKQKIVSKANERTMEEREDMSWGDFEH